VRKIMKTTGELGVVALGVSSLLGAVAWSRASGQGRRVKNDYGTAAICGTAIGWASYPSRGSPRPARTQEAGPLPGLTPTSA
jgi:hypothetical protein